jgi:tripartite-type tricarboxylate transporter receptor subunit TctC
VQHERIGIAAESALPAVPTVAESVPAYEASQLFGLGAPRSIPAEIVATLNREINAGLFRRRR